MRTNTSFYNAEISAGSLMLPESRRVAAFMLAGPDESAWRKAFSLEENLLQKNKPATARRMGRLIRNRLETVSEETLRLIAEGDREVALQVLLACAIKHSCLLGHYLRDIYRERLRRLEKTLDPKEWETFLHECEHRDPAVSEWSESTRKKIYQVIIRILAEGGYLKSTRGLELTIPHLHPLVINHLKSIGWQDILTVMDIER
jgi:hypothetical protein